MARLQPTLLIPISVVALIVLGLLGWIVFSRSRGHIEASTTPVPPAIKSSVSFPIYFPDTSKLPGGYTLDTSSFSSGSGVVEFVVDHGAQKLIFTEQPEPSYAQLQTFVAQRLPLHNQVNVKAGTATIGAMSNSSVVSLPTNDNVWILVTAPYATDQRELQQVLNSLSK